MAARTWVLILIAASVALAGCTNRDSGAGGDADNGGSPTGPGGPSGPGGSPGPGAAPQDFVLEDSGAIQGPFSQSWTITVANVAFSAANVHFEISGVQAGAPPTARVNLAFLDPEGNTVRSDVVGMGGSGNVVDWAFTPADLPVAGDYTLQATAGDAAPLPSVGLANYLVHAEVLY